MAKIASKVFGSSPQSPRTELLSPPNHQPPRPPRPSTASTLGGTPSTATSFRPTSNRPGSQNYSAKTRHKMREISRVGERPADEMLVDKLEQFFPGIGNRASTVSSLRSNKSEDYQKAQRLRAQQQQQQLQSQQSSPRSSSGQRPESTEDLKNIIQAAIQSRRMSRMSLHRQSVLRRRSTLHQGFAEPASSSLAASMSRQKTAAHRTNAIGRISEASSPVSGRPSVATPDVDAMAEDAGGDTLSVPNTPDTLTTPDSSRPPSGVPGVSGRRSVSRKRLCRLFC